MESRFFAGICGDFSSTNPLWRNRGEVERFFAGGMVERLWSGNEKLVEKSVENPVDAGGGFHSLWKRLCTGLHRRFHSGRRHIREISCGGEFFFSTWVFHSLWKTVWKTGNFLWRGGGKPGFSKKSHVSTGNARQKKRERKRKRCGIVSLSGCSS